MKRVVLKLFTGLVLSLVTLYAHGQPGGGGPGGGQEPADVPISGIEFILAGGMIYGARKIYQARKNR